MSERTLGATRDCAGCRYWSEMIARASSPNMVLRAMCLADGGPRASQYVTAHETCDRWRPGVFGAIDDPAGAAHAYGDEEL